MEFNVHSEIVKDLNFGDQAKSKIMSGVEKLNNCLLYTSPSPRD